MALKPLNHHYSFENPASVYDEEALTALELAGRTTAKVNETVQAFNELETQTNEHLENQDKTIDQRMDSQDNRITTMNDVTMPAKVKSEFQRNLDNGTFEDMVDTYAGNLESRVNNLLSSIPEGGTTMDAEVIDLRIASNNDSYTTAGASIRTLSTSLHDKVKNVAEPICTPVEGVATGGYFLNDGTIMDNATIGHVYHTFTVNPGETYLITTRYGDMCPCALVVDANGGVVLISGIRTGITTNVVHELTIPEAGATMYVNNINNAGKALVEKVVDYVVNTQSVTQMLVGMVNNAGIEFNVPKTYDDVLINYCLITGVLTETEDKNERFKVYIYPVSPGEVLNINSRIISNNALYQVQDEAGKVLLTGDLVTADGTYNETVVIPVRGAKIYVFASLSEPSVNNPGNIKEAQKKIKWACLGDSLTESNLRTTKNYHDYVGEKLGAEVVNMGVSGTGYMRSQDQGNAFYQRISNVPLDADVVTIFGSGNDLGLISSLGDPADTGTDTLCGCINTTIDNLYSILPTVQLGIVAPTPWVNNEPGDNGSMVRYCEALEAICKRRGIPYLDLFHCSGLRPNDETFRAMAYSKDDGNGVHPDETGHKMIASQFYAFMLSLIGAY